jgi:hypothetical protein
VFTKQTTFTKLQSRTEVILRKSAAFNLNIFRMNSLRVRGFHAIAVFFQKKDLHGALHI